MKQGIHPTFYEDALVICACGNTWKTGSTKKEIHTDVCSKCHPFYTGEQRIVDTAGQVERFMKRAAAKEQLAPKPEAQVQPSKKERRARVRGDMRSGMRRPGAAAPAPAETPLEPSAPVSESAAESEARTPDETAPISQAPLSEAGGAPEAATPEASAPRAHNRPPRGPRAEGEGERRPRPPRKPRPAAPSEPVQPGEANPEPGEANPAPGESNPAEPGGE